MLGFVRHFMPHRGLPIGVDFGARSLRLAQVDETGANIRLVHAEHVEVPAGTLADAEPAGEFLARALRVVLAKGTFRGRQIALSLPSAFVQVRHVRIAKGAEQDEAAEARALAAAQLGGAPADWHVRHVVAGDAFADDGTAQREAIAFATPLDTVAALLDAASRARAEVVGVQVQPRVLANGFTLFYRRDTDAQAVNLFVDLGAGGTNAFVAAPTDIRFVRGTRVGVDAAHARIAQGLGQPPADVARLRTLAISRQTLLTHELPATAPAPGEPELRLAQLTTIEAARIAEELDLCRRYHEATFPAQPVTRLVFVGGGAKDRLLCAAIAQAMALPAQIGDPLVRFHRGELPALACLDRREPQPEWALAIALSMCGRTVATTA